jgi:hypothetical protein
VVLSISWAIRRRTAAYNRQLFGLDELRMAELAIAFIPDLV